MKKSVVNDEVKGMAYALIMIGKSLGEARQLIQEWGF